eukprot:TRINITY_DN2145_c0_g1_i1.p1 TRINITY_DN2145_c0_g1~~TRINITY_DN2145_c0_g1_i1.p1  ORF type:complete len:1083 (+),score=558.65 TRINITY_DN2145_c0_g1_i1:136-3384(+)
MEFPDVHHKMSKKIAQLTKVIYHLNTRNDDSEYQMQQITDMYECEIQDILSDAKKKIMTFKEQLEDSRSQDKTKLAVQELTKLHDKEKAEMVNEFSLFRKKAVENEAMLKARAEEHIAKLTGEVQTMKDAFASRCHEFEQGQKGLEQQGYDALGELRKLKDDEMEKMVVEYNEKYKAMLAKQMSLQDELEANLTKEWGAKLEAEEKAHVDSRQLLGADIAELKRRIAEFDKGEAAMKEKIKALEAQGAEFEAAIEGLKSNEKDLNQALQATMAKLDAEEGKVKAQIEKATELSKQLAEAQGACRELEKKLLEMQRARDSLSMDGNEKQKLMDDLHLQVQNITAELADKTKLHEAFATDLQNQLQDATNETLSVKEALAKAEERLQTTQDELRKEGARLVDAQAECDRLQQQLKQEREKATERERELESTIADLERAVRTAVEDGESARNLLSQNLDGQVAALREEKANALADMEADHKERTERAAAIYEEKVASLKRDFADEKAGLAAEHAQAVDALNATIAENAQSLAERDAKISALEAEVARITAEAADVQKSISASASGEKQGLLDELAVLRQQLQDTASDLGAAKAKANIAATEAAHREEGLKEKVAGLEKQVAELEAELDALKREKEASLAALRSQGGEELDRLRKEKEQEHAARIELELAKLKDTLSSLHEQKLARVEEEHRAALAAAEKAFAAEKEALAGKIAALEGTVAAKISEIEALGSSMTGNADAWKMEKDRLVASHNDKEKGLKAAFADDVASLEAKLARAKEQELSAQAQRHQQDLTALRKEHEAAVKDLTGQNRRELEEARREHAQALKEALAAKEEEHGRDSKRLLDAKDSEHKAELARLRGAHDEALGGAEKDRERLLKNLSALEGSLHTLRQQLAAEQESRAKDNARAREEIEEADRSLQAKVKAMKERQANDVRALKDSQAAAIQKLSEEFGLVQRAMKERNQQLETAVAELEYKYANRESRDEDVDRINKLMAAVAAKDEALVKAFNELRWYKLELVNREENYNKVFGRQPTVANGRADAAGDASGKSGAGVWPNANLPGQGPAPGEQKGLTSRSQSMMVKAQ